MTRIALPGGRQSACGLIHSPTCSLLLWLHIACGLLRTQQGACRSRIAVVPLGFAVYLMLNWRVSGDPFAFLSLRQQLFHMHFSWPWNGIADAFRNLRRTPNQAEIVGTQELIFTGLGFVCSVVSWIRLRPIYAMWITANWLLLVCVSFIESMPRYAVTMFPIFFLFAFVAENRFWKMVITVWSILFFALFSGLFARGWWVF